MTSVPVFRRQLCAQCQRPQSNCTCNWVTPIESKLEILILQHPLEIHHAKGSARLLHLSLAQSILVAGEVFPEEQLQKLLHAPLGKQHQQAGRQRPYPILLYPDTLDEKSVGIAAPPAPEEALLNQPSLLRLVVLDGTWRKSRKMIYLNPMLQALPRLALNDLHASGYSIRKAQRAGQLSTLEATCHALAQLEGDPEKYRPLLAAFDGFVAQQAAYGSGQKA